MQEYYAQKLGWHTVGMQMSDVYTVWSATNTVQMMSEHIRDTTEMKKYLGLGQNARFWYGHRPKHDKEDAYRDANLGILIELHTHHINQANYIKTRFSGLQFLLLVMICNSLMLSSCFWVYLGPFYLLLILCFFFTPYPSWSHRPFFHMGALGCS